MGLKYSAKENMIKCQRSINISCLSVLTFPEFPRQLIFKRQSAMLFCFLFLIKEGWLCYT